MKKIGYLLIMFTILLHLTPLNTAEAATNNYTGGLLDGVALSVGPSFGNQTSTVTELTDNDESTFKNLQGNIAWYSFSNPVDINAVIAKWVNNNYPIKIEFFDSSNTLISTYTPSINDGMESLPNTVQNVSSVVFKAANSGSNIYARELNIFTTPTLAPTVPSINWHRGGNSVVDLYWNDTKAKSFTIKRAGSAGGPYTTIASNITETSFTDRSVLNGTKYYYIVTAVNEAGESGNSNEISITPSFTKYTGGLLDGLPLNVGSSITNATSIVREFTDNNGNTSRSLGNGNIAWYTFSNPVNINAVIAKWANSYSFKVEFYDSSNTLLSTYTPTTNDGVESLPNIIQSVSSVILKPATGSNIYAYEFNIFTTPTFAPTAPSIDWHRGGDSVVDLYWNTTGAKSYTVKRAITKGGPYTTIASDIKKTSFTDSSVLNGTKYYYIVTAVNEAGESANSNEVNTTPSSTKYTGGLLDGRALNVGKSFNNATSIVREYTDNNVSTSKSLGNGNIAWYTFPSPVDINAVITKWANNYSFKVEFYDSSNTLLSTYTPTTNDVLESLPSVIQNVSTIIIKPTGSNIDAYEFNVFGEGKEETIEAPQNLVATGGNKTVSLSWNSISNATGYSVKRSTIAGGPYVEISNVNSATYSFVDTNVVNGTNYYYVVTALTTVGESPNSNVASATPQGTVITPPPAQETGDRALLSIMLSNGEEKEYDLSMTEVNSFISWYDGRASGAGSIMFALDKHSNNKGPFKNRKDYIVYDKIIMFEVNSYSLGSNDDIGYDESELH